MRDILERYWLPGVLIITVLTRLPYLWTGYGADDDAWFLANSASTLWNTGQYFESRLPGYPLHEFISAPLVGVGGAPLSNSATLIVTLIAIVVWFNLTRIIGRHKKLLVISFAFAPVVWQHSADTLDYLWSLLFILISFNVIIRQRILMAGIALGIAVGFRPSNLITIIPFLYLLSSQQQNRREIPRFILSVLVVALCAFTPLILKYGIPGWFIATLEEMKGDHLPMVMRLSSFLYRIVYFMGPLTVITLGVIFWMRREDIFASIRSRENIVVTSILGIFTFLGLFLWMPVERAYLLPAFPFLLLLVDRFASKKQFILFTALLIVSALLSFDVIDANNRQSIQFNIRPGMVIEEQLIRKRLLQERTIIASTIFPDSSMIMTSSGPGFWFENECTEPADDQVMQKKLFYTEGQYKLTRQKGPKTVLFIAYLKNDELSPVREGKLHIYCLASAKKKVESVTGYTLESKGITVLQNSHPQKQ